MLIKRQSSSPGLIQSNLRRFISRNDDNTNILGIDDASTTGCFAVNPMLNFTSGFGKTVQYDKRTTYDYL